MSWSGASSSGEVDMQLMWTILPVLLGDHWNSRSRPRREGGEAGEARKTAKFETRTDFDVLCILAQEPSFRIFLHHVTWSR